MTTHPPAEGCEDRVGSSVLSPQDVLADTSASDWLKAALRTALQRDPVDAAHDAERLAAILEANLRHIVE